MSVTTFERKEHGYLSALQKKSRGHLARDHPSQSSSSIIAGSRVYAGKEFMIIVSDGDVDPPGVTVVKRGVDEILRKTVLNKHLNDSLNFNELSQSAALDVKTIANKIDRSKHKYLTSLKLDVAGEERPKEYYLQAIENFIQNCKQPGGTATI